MHLLWSCKPQEQPQHDHLNWYKGNLHTHSLWSDGDDYPEMIMKWYQEHGYHFVALTDHNILAVGDKWITVEDSLDKAVFERYLDTFGTQWISFTDSDTVKVKLKTLEEYRPLFEKEGEFLVLQSEEITDRFEEKPIHLNATNLDELIPPQGGNSVVDVLQRNINAVLDQREKTGIPMLVHINHPNFHFAITIEDMIALQGEQFFEVFNGHHMVYNFGDSLHLDTETMWDQINIAYANNGKPLLYGLATDDSHNYHQNGVHWSNSGRGWIWTQSKTLTPSAIIEAMELGNFYASSGVELKSLKTGNNEIQIELGQDNNQYTIQFIGCNRTDSQTRILKEVEGYAATFQLNPDHLFVRAKVISSAPPKNPIENMQHQIAWTQPVMYMPASD